MKYHLFSTFFFIILSTSYYIHQQINQILNQNNLQFSNALGPNTTQKHIESFQNFINSASSFYRDSTELRLAYISNQINSLYGNSHTGVSVIQEGKDFIFDWDAKSSSGIYASVPSGTDKIYPNYSYMFLLEPIYGDRVFLFGLDQKGSGITEQMGYMIFRIIQTHEKPDACVCDGNSKNIADDLNKLDNGNWNVFCYTTSALFYLSIYPRNDKYLFTKGKNCYYGIYEV